MEVREWRGGHVPLEGTVGYCKPRAGCSDQLSWPRAGAARCGTQLQGPSVQPVGHLFVIVDPLSLRCSADMEAEGCMLQSQSHPKDGVLVGPLAAE